MPKDFVYQISGQWKFVGKKRYEKCPICHGSGRVLDPDPDSFGIGFADSVQCSRCHGKKQIEFGRPNYPRRGWEQELMNHLAVEMRIFIKEKERKFEIMNRKF